MELGEHELAAPPPVTAPDSGTNVSTSNSVRKIKYSVSESDVGLTACFSQRPWV
jgi:hypothetical protein